MHTPPKTTIPSAWRRWFGAFIRNLYFSRITVIGGEHIPAAGPVLAVCLHRNGAVDGFVYRGVLPQVSFMLSARLRKSWIGRLFFDGVEVERRQDGGKRANTEAIEECLAWLAGAGWMGVFPEGTSQLGPRHLPFKSGAARIALRQVEAGRPLTVLPLGIHYEEAWAFRSRVEVVVGPAVSMDLPASLVTPGARLQEVKQRLATALEAVGANFVDAATQNMAEKLASAATLETKRTYFSALTCMEQRLPAAAVEALAVLEEKCLHRRVWRYQGVPLFSRRWPWASALLALLLAGPVFAGFLVNIGPVAVAAWAGRRFPDDTNVIALWRILTGVPLLILWALGWCAAGLVTGLWWLPLLYLLLTWVAVQGWSVLKKLAVATWNGLLHPGMRPAAFAVRHAVTVSLNSLPRG